ncbi:MAG: DeoR/GlpR transcriptional regulator [Abditibacteriota bacterium]|nr:DeoR/GlpR transcriptional regulator [Abditibacteriota bacterium]
MKAEGVIRISELVPKVASSMMTIRRDLDEMESRGLLTRIHGGAVLAKESKKDSLQPSFQQRMEEHIKEKKHIARLAARMVENGDILYLDGGTTPYLMLDFIDPDICFTVITTALMTATKASSFSNANVICIGGSIHKSSYSTTGTIAIENIDKFHANKAFISTKAFALPLGCYEADMNLIETKKAIVRNADEIILLADFSKFSGKSLCPSVTLSSINKVVTDAATDANILKTLTDKGIEVVK